MRCLGINIKGAFADALIRESLFHIYAPGFLYAFRPLSEGFFEPLPETSKMVETSDTIASSRLDCVVSVLASVSRGRSCELIENGFVSINSVVCEKTPKLVESGDIITVRGKGKFVITSLSGRTKKQRTVLEFKKYL